MSKDNDDDATDDKAAAPLPPKMLEDDGAPISMRDVELEPVSLHEIEMILAPGRAPPRLNKTPSNAPPALNKDGAKRLPSIPRRPLPSPAKPKYEPDSDSGTLDLKELAREMAPEAPPPKRASIPDAELANIGTGMMAASPAMPLEPPTETKADSEPAPKVEEPKPRAPVKAPVKKRPAVTESVEEPSAPSKRASTRPSTTAFTALANVPSVAPRAEAREESGGGKTLWLVLGGAALLGIGFFVGRQTSSAPAAPEPRAPAAATTNSAASDAVCAPVVSASAVATTSQSDPTLATTVSPSAEPAASSASTSSSATATTAALVPTTPTTRSSSTTATTTATTTVPPAKSSAAPTASGPFDKAAANAALSGLVGSAAGCKQPGDPSGTAQVTVTFAPSGRVTTSSVSGPPFQGTATGGCIARAFKAATVPPFNGDPTTVTKTVHIP